MLKKGTRFFFLTTILIVAFFIFDSKKVFADISKISFITDPQSISSGQISGPITIQLQDQSGNEQKANETIYINLSSSASGEFSSNKDTWKIFTTLPSDFSTSSIYISTNSANRTFYYKGLADGVHQITVSAKSKSGKVFDNITQNITVGDNSTTSTTTQNDDISPNTTDNNTTTATTVKTITRYVSLHSSPEELSNYDESSSFEISAGRERITYVGVPISFIAKHKVAQNVSVNTYKFDWSYGDGTGDEGEKVLHTYKNPGEYNVVLNGEYGDKSAVSRTIVRVLSPELSLNNTESRDIEIKNNGKTEINLGGWIINNSNTKFVFPKDTLIGANKSIILSKEDSKIINNDEEVLILNTPSNREVVSFKIFNVNPVSQNLVTTTSIEKIINMTTKEAEDIILNYKKKFSTVPIIKEKNKIVIATTTENKIENQKLIQTATVLQSIESTSTSGFWNSRIEKVVKSFGRIFYDF